MQLRPYQNNLLRDIFASWQSGNQNVLAVLPTGAGKTVVLSEVVRLHNGGSCVIAHRQELVSQISLALAKDEVRHRIIGPTPLIKWIVQLHIQELGRDFYDPSSRHAVAGVDTLIRRQDDLQRWAQQVTLWVQDEAHHVLRDNKWGTAVGMFPNARGLGVTATPERADGKGLGRTADGVFDHMLVGPGMRDLIGMGYLTDYRVFCPPSDLDLTEVATGADGDYIRGQLALKTRRSSVMGDVVDHYQRIAAGKLGVTFAPDVETATELSVRFNQAGVPAEVVSAKTPDRTRQEILRRFRRRELLQLVNVDLFGEGFDLPAIEVVSMARATQSYGLYCLDPDTEVLTPNGWKKCDDVENQVVAFDIDNDIARTVDITARVKRRIYDHEKMYEMKGPHLDFCVSDNHNLVVKGRKAKYWMLHKCEDVSTFRSMVKVPVSSDGCYAGSGLSKENLQFLGWFLSDGSINKKTNGLTIPQSVNKQKHIDLIRNTIRDCGFKWGEGIVKRVNVPKSHHDLHRFNISKGAPRGRDKHLTGWGRLEEWMDKSIPSCYDTLTREELLILLETLNLGDGTNDHSSLDYIKRTMTITCGTNYHMADRIQMLCVTRGLRCNLSIVQYEGRSKWAYLHIRDTKTATIAGNGNKDGKISGKKGYKRSRLKISNRRPDFVWCVSNSLNTLITRRNGKVVILGNCQQFGRALRTTAGKDRALIIDHVGNVVRHGLPDRPRIWSLERREKRVAKQPAEDVIPLRTCLNPACMAPYERVLTACPFCGSEPIPTSRTAPEFVDGDLCELDEATLAAMRGEVAKVDRHPDQVLRGMQHAGHPYMVAKAAANRHGERMDAQTALRQAMALWAGYQRALGRSDREGYRRFYHGFGVDVMTAQALGRAEAETLTAAVCESIMRLDAEWRAACG